MNILQIGKAKSGNYWLYKILQSALEKFDLSKASFIQQHPIQEIAKNWELSYEEQRKIDVIDIEENGLFFRISNIFRHPICSPEQYISETNHVWTHSEFNANFRNMSTYFDKIFYLIRDPRDCLLSYADFLFTDYMRTYRPHDWTSPGEFIQHNYISHTLKWIDHVSGYLQNLRKFHIYPVFYEGLKMNPRDEIRGILTFLDQDFDSSDVDEICEKTTYQSMSEDEPEHVRKGRLGAWKTKLTRFQQYVIRFIAHPLMQVLGYPCLSGESVSVPNHERRMLTGFQEDLKGATRACETRKVPGKVLNYFK